MKKIIEIIKNTVADGMKVRKGELLELAADEAKSLVLMGRAIFADIPPNSEEAIEDAPAQDVDNGSGKRRGKKRG